MNEIEIKIENLRNRIAKLRKERGVRAAFTEDIRNEIIYLIENSRLHKYELSQKLNVSKVALTRIHNKHTKTKKDFNSTTYEESTSNLDMVELDNITHLQNLINSQKTPTVVNRQPSLKITTKSGNVIEIY